MSVHRIMGIENEYGIAVAADPAANPMLLSSQVVNAYANETMPNRMRRMRWDYDVETPLRDARGYDMSRADADPSQLTDEDFGVANVVLTNGARFYVDHAHPEYAAPEVTNPRDASLWDVAGDRIIQRSAELASSLTNQLITVYKNNTDGKGASYGTHENYQLSRETPFPQLIKFLTPFFVTRCLFAGAGRVGLGQEGDEPGFQISSRADFFEAEVGLETTLRRPIINTRDEPHADPDKFRRLHVIVGDANMSQRMTYLKMGSTALVLSMIEDGFLDFDVELHDPVSAMHQVSHDYELVHRVRMKDGRELSALEIQRMFIEQAHRYVAATDADEMTLDVLSEWTRVVETLATDKFALRDEVDWIAKLAIMNGYRERDHALWNDPRIAAIDIQYADMRKEKGLALLMQAKGKQQVMFTEQEIAQAVVTPPHDTRAYFRGKCVEHFVDQVAAASWDSVILDLGSDVPLTRISTPDVRKGTKDLTESLFVSATGTADFVRKLQP